MSALLRLILLLAVGATVFGQPLPEPGALLKRVQARMEALSNEPSTNRYFYTRTNVVEELDSDGNLKKRSEKTYLVELVQGLPRSRLVALDGRALPESEQKWRNAEERKLQRSFTPEGSGDDKKAKAWLTDDLLERFIFAVTARTNLQGRAVVIMTFKPEPEAPVKSMVDRIVSNMAGELWIDEEEAEVARIDLGMGQPVKFWGGLLGQIDKFNWTLKRMRTPEGVWFNQLSDGLFQVRKLFSTTRYKLFEESFNFRAAP